MGSRPRGPSAALVLERRRISRPDRSPNMNMQRDPREASPRAVEGAPTLATSWRGRSTAPHLSIWLPIAVKGAAAAGVALILAVIGVKAGAHGPPPPFEPASSATAPL